MSTYSTEQPDGPRDAAREVHYEGRPQSDASGGPLIVTAVVRPYAQSDREALIAFYERFEPKRAAQGLPPEGRVRIEHWLDDILKDGVHLVIGKGERIIAHAFVLPAGASRTGEYAVFVDAAERGRGLGTEMNRASVRAARQAGFTRLWLTAEPHNRPAIASYRKVGFQFVPQTLYGSELEMELALES